MVLIVCLALFLLIFFCVKKHAGPAHLAMIAGLSVHALFGQQFAGQISNWIPALDLWWVEKIIYVALILVFPLLLYFRSERGGLHGILRLVESVLFAVLLTALIAGPLSEIFAFDGLSRTIAGFIHGIEGYIILVGIIFAYLDILIYHRY